MASTTAGSREETKAEVEACARELGRTVDQLARWRREGLLPDARQEAHGVGSAVFYPAGTCAQLRALSELMNRNASFKYVGRRLWWSGYPVDERYYRNDLIRAAGLIDRLLPLALLLSARLARTDRTMGDYLASQPTPPASVAKRIERRLDLGQRATLLGLFAEVAAGDFEAYDPNHARDEEDSRSREGIVELALDIEGIDGREIRGQSLKHQFAMPTVLTQLASILAEGDMVSVATGSIENLEAARDDVRLALKTAEDMHDALGWIYPNMPTGFRLAAWVAKKLKPEHVPILLFCFVRLRELDALVEPEAIRVMAQQAEFVRAASMRLKEVREGEPALARIISPARLRSVLADADEGRRFTAELRSARLKLESQAGV